MTRSLLCTALLAMLSVTSWVQATPTITRVPGTNGSPPVYAAIGNNPLYQGSGMAGENPLYKGQNRVTPPGMSNVGMPSVNDKGDIAFKSLSPIPEYTGIFVLPRGGNIPITIYGEPYGGADGAPVINNANQVVFKGLASAQGGGLPVVKLATPSASGGYTVTVVGSGFSQVNAPSIDSAGNVAFTGTTDTGEGALFVRSASGGDILTIRGENFGTRVQMSDPPSGRATGKRIFTPFITPGGGGGPATSELVSYDVDLATGEVFGFTRWMPPEVLTTKTNFAVLLQGNGAGKKSAVSTGNGIYLCGETDHFIMAGGARNVSTITTEEIIQVGDTLDGATVTDLDLAPQSWGSEYSLTFWAALSDGTSGLFVYSMPEPGTLGALAVAATLFRRRR